MPTTAAADYVPADTAGGSVPLRRLAGAPQWARALAAAIATGLGYAAGSQLAFWWFNATGVSATFFPAAGVTLAALVLAPRRWWPLLLAAAATAEITLDTLHGIALGPTLGYALANVVEPTVGASLLLALAPRPDLERMRDLVAFLACAVAIAPVVGASVGATTFVLAQGGDWLAFARSWWAGDGLGVLVFGAMLVAGARRLGTRRAPVRPLETLAVVSAVAGATALVFWLHEPALGFVPFGLLLLASFRLGSWAVAAAGAATATVAAQATADGHVFWESLSLSPATGLVYLQLLVAFVVATPLLLAAALRGRDVAVSELDSARRREAIAEASAALAAAQTEQEVIDAYVELGRRRLGAARGVLALVDGDALVPRFARGVDPVANSTSLPRESPAGDAIASGQRVLVPTRAELRRRYPTLADDFRSDGVEALAVVPLPPVAAAPEGAVALSFERPRTLDSAEWELLESVAGSVAQAIARARLYERVEEQAHAARILSRIGEGVVQVDAERRVVAWNGTAERITGIPAAAAVGAPAGAIFPGWAELERQVPVAATPDVPQERVTLPVESGGRTLWLGFTGVAYSDGVIYAFRDETADRDLDRMRRDLIATTSHQLRTPLTGLYGAALTLAREDVDVDDETRSRLLGMMVAECERLSTLVDEILLAGQLESGSLRLASETVDVGALLEEVAASVRPALSEGASLTIAAPPLVVRADRDRLRQVVTNLVDNARKYSPDGGTIALAAARDRGHVVVTVADEGIGIPPQEQEHVFERFYRLDPSLTRGVGGTGLGLYICRELVERMGGSIALESEPGRGTTVSVRLPG